MTDFIQRGQAAIQGRDFPVALHCFEQAATADPDDPQAKACLGQTLCWMGQVESGVGYLRDAGRKLLKQARKTGDISLVLSLTEQLQHWNDYPGALALGREAVQVNPAQVRGYQLLALSYSRLNQPQPALTAARRAASLAPQSAMLQILLATLEATNKDHDAARQRLEQVLTLPNLSAEEKFRAHKELAIVLDKLKHYPAVFPHLHAAATIATSLPEVTRLDPALVPNMLKTNEQEFDPALLGRWRGAPFPAAEPAAPIFLMGFMRSGTTLTQEVLGTHPNVFVADEPSFTVALVDELTRIMPTPTSVPARLRELDFDGVLHLRKTYWDLVRGRFGDAFEGRVFVDKTTMNSIDAGLINVLFPDGKILFLVRDARDVCLSCFMQIMTPTPSTMHLLTWEGTARFHAQTLRFWQTIKPRLTIPFLELRYEDAVRHFEPVFRDVLSFIGVEWDAGVLDFHRRASGRYIASPSFSQVAQPLYASSIGRWQHYAAEFEAILPVLRPALVDQDYSL